MQSFEERHGVHLRNLWESQNTCEKSHHIRVEGIEAATIGDLLLHIYNTYPMILEGSSDEVRSPGARVADAPL